MWGNDTDEVDAERLLARLGAGYNSSGSWSTGPMQTRQDALDELSLAAAARPGLARAAVRLALKRQEMPEIELLVDQIPDGGLAAVAAGAMDVLIEGDCVWESRAAWLVSRVAQQDPAAMSPHRQSLLNLVLADPPTEPWWVWPSEWAWRDAPDADLEMLEKLLDHPDLPVRTTAWACLVASRTPVGLALALATRGRQVPDDHHAAECLLLAAQDPDVPGRSLMAVATPHLLDIPKRHYARDAKPLLGKAPGMGAGKPAPSGHGTFGGTAPGPCPCCGGPLQRVLEVAELAEQPPLPPVLTCASCIGLAVEFLFIDHTNGPVAIEVEEVVGDPEPRDRLREVPLYLRPAPGRSVLPSIELTGSQCLDRIGGEPAWSEAAFPNCPRCQLRMPFLAQVTSHDLRDGGPRPAHVPAFSWGETGMLWAFWCEPCEVSATFVPFAEDPPPPEADNEYGAYV